MSRVVLVGDALIDEIRDDHGVREFVGGAALNVAVGLSRLGVPASLIAMVGDDEAGDHIRSYLGTFGVELIATPGPHGSSRAVSTRSSHGEPEYEFNAAAKERRIRFGDAERAALADAAVVAISCFPFDDVAQTRELSQSLGSALLAIDPNPRTDMMTDRLEFVRGFEALVHGAALVKIGDDDAKVLYGEPLDAVRTRLVDLGAAAVLATQGADGAAVEVGGAVVTRPVSVLPGRIVDTMGAGDAVFASVLATLSGGIPVDAEAWGDVLQEAMDVAAATCRFEGALLRLPSSLRDMDLESLGT